MTTKRLKFWPETNPATLKLLACLLLVLLLPLSNSHLVAGDEASSSEPSTTTGDNAAARNIISQPASVNLKAILEHQEALAEECAKYHEESVRQLEYLVKFNDDNDLVELPEPISVKVPAVCLFVFSQFNQVKPFKDHHQQPKRLDFVNWIFNQDEVRAMNNGSMSKRQAGNSNLLGDYLFDPLLAFNETTDEKTTNNQIETDEEEGAKNIDTLVTDKRFKEMISKKKAQLDDYLSPVVLIPGLLGSRLQAKTYKTNRVNIFCGKKGDWQEMWLSIRLLLPIAVDCWLDNVRREYDPNTGYTKQPKGVEVRVPDFGSVESVRNLDLKQPKLTGYYSSIINQYEQLGYTADKNLFAAPYDFRLAPQELIEYFADLKKLIEKAQQDSANKKKVTLVCHSMGCTHLLIFLRMQSATWRQSRVRKMIALSSPWGGATKALKALVVGDQLDLPLVSEYKIRKLAQTFPSIAFLLPQAEVYGRPNKNHLEAGGPVLVQTPQKNYFAHNMDELLKDLNLDHQLEWFRATSSLIKPLEPLADLNVDCIHSLNIPTPETMIFRNQTDFPDGEYELIKGEGDGTVNFESLMICQDWQMKLPDKVKHKIIQSTNHNGVLSHKTLLAHIREDVLMNDS